MADPTLRPFRATSVRGIYPVPGGYFGRVRLALPDRPGGSLPRIAASMRAMRCASAQLRASSANTVPVRGGGLYLTARTRVVSPTGDEECIPVLQADDPEDASLLQQAETIFEDDMEPEDIVLGEEVVPQVVTDEGNETAPGPADNRINPNFGRPKKDKHGHRAWRWPVSEGS